MQVILFIGVQATGKSSFYRERFYKTHVRINRDMLRTPYRERLLVQACLQGKIPFVLDRMNHTLEGRRAWMEQFRAAGFSVTGYFFECRLANALQRNASRPPDEMVPDVAIKGALSQMQRPSLAEGFEALYYVRLTETGFTVNDWKEDSPHEI